VDGAKENLESPVQVGVDPSSEAAKLHTVDSTEEQNGNGRWEGGKGSGTQRPTRNFYAESLKIRPDGPRPEGSWNAGRPT